ncbi:MAG: hypothetical protein IKH98_07525, partial [Candidatus Methanomethylophilaceae archaeon]|nr:hypothetical protein [Candidatus Methanomethylophilaceae archaeon]
MTMSFPPIPSAFSTKNKGFDSEQYDLLLNELKSEDHPLLERPYLFTKLINIAFEDEISPLS